MLNTSTPRTCGRRQWVEARAATCRSRWTYQSPHKYSQYLLLSSPARPMGLTTTTLPKSPSWVCAAESLSREGGNDGDSFLSSSPPSGGNNNVAGNGTFVLMLLCVLGFLFDHVLHLPFMSSLYLHHSHPQWWQFFTHQFCHGNLSHLSSNLFQLCVFGRFVEETEGAFGVIAIFILTGLGAAAASIVALPGSIGVGASGAIFGLFATSVLLRITRGFSIKSALEALVLGQFVVRQLIDEMRHQVVGGISSQGMQVAHIAHLGGALAGVLLVLALHKLPKGDSL